jgi:hypothetical protein
LIKAEQTSQRQGYQSYPCPNEPFHRDQVYRESQTALRKPDRGRIVADTEVTLLTAIAWQERTLK